MVSPQKLEKETIQLPVKMNLRFLYLKKSRDNVIYTLFYTNISDFSEDWVGMIYEGM